MARSDWEQTTDDDWVRGYKEVGVWYSGKYWLIYDDTDLGDGRFLCENLEFPTAEAAMDYADKHYPMEEEEDANRTGNQNPS